MSAWKDRRVIGDATLYLGDCLDVLPTLGPVDAVVTDPPYSENTHRMAKTNKGAGHGTKPIPFEAISDSGFAATVSALLEASRGWLVATCDYKHAATMFEHPQFVRLGAWVKPNPMPQISADRPGQGFETVLIMHSGKELKKWNRGGGAGVWTHPVHCGAEVPTQKPLNLILEFVSDFTQPGETILDPFMGSGTTGVAALKMGRKFIGIEIDPGYFEIACKRVAEAHAQPDLFINRQPEPEQEQLL